MITHSYSLSTTDGEAFARLLKASAGLGVFKVQVTEVPHQPPQRPAGAPPVAISGPADGMKQDPRP